MIIMREKDILKWAGERNIILGSEPEAQFAKTLSEWKEWLKDRSKDDIGDIVVTLVIGNWLSNGHYLSEFAEPDALRHFENVDDVERVIKSLLGELYDEMTEEACLSSYDYAEVYEYMVELARLSGWTIEECIEVAWQDIKDRKGMLLHGTFVKEATLNQLAAYGVYPAKGRLESVVRTMEQRSQVAGVITSHEFTADSKFDKASGTWTVFSTGLQKETVKS